MYTASPASSKPGQSSTAKNPIVGSVGPIVGREKPIVGRDDDADAIFQRFFYALMLLGRPSWYDHITWFMKRSKKMALNQSVMLFGMLIFRCGRTTS